MGLYRIAKYFFTFYWIFLIDIEANNEIIFLLQAN